jgi:MoxR-like ATPase
MIPGAHVTSQHLADVVPLPSRGEAALVAARLVANVEHVVHGRRAAVELVIGAVLAGGHVLVEDVPGSGKTTLARAVARSLGGSFRRIQGTADLRPADITGSGVWEPEHRSFRFVPGPVFANVVLVDELNRTPPRTQSAFLEAMDESAVTIDGQRHALPDPFVVLATQNPLEQFGTYPLPEGQLDRFAVTLSLGANDPATERLVVREQLDHATVGELEAVTSPAQLVHVRAEVRRTHVADQVLDHAVRIAELTREHPAVALGASTRAALALVRCAQARALLGGRDHVLPDDVKALAPNVLGHRLVLRQDGSGMRAGQRLVAELVAALAVPLQA